jgi:hypothetical protein
MGYLLLSMPRSVTGGPRLFRTVSLRRAVNSVRTRKTRGLTLDHSPRPSVVLRSMLFLASTATLPQTALDEVGAVRARDPRRSVPGSKTRR